MLSDNCYAVVMAGGAGTRLWPLSSRDMPKHFLKLFGGRSLIELTVDKLSGHIPDDRILILTSVKYKAVAQQTLPQIPPENFVYEPCLRDTASAIGLAATVLKTRCPAATMIVLTADQIIEPADQFNTAIANAATFLELHPDQLVAFGVEAASPSTLVGWQKLGETVDFPGCEVRRIAAFTEKPELEIAQRYMNEGGYCWNSGQFAWKAETILQGDQRSLAGGDSLARANRRSLGYAASANRSWASCFPRCRRARSITRSCRRRAMPAASSCPAVGRIWEPMPHWQGELARNVITMSSWARQWFRERKTSSWPIQTNMSLWHPTISRLS